jgi:hypothetical protein
MDYRVVISIESVYPGEEFKMMVGSVPAGTGWIMPVDKSIADEKQVYRPLFNRCHERLFLCTVSFIPEDTIITMAHR